MLFQASQCWLTWCLSPWKQACWRGIRFSSWVEIRNRWRLSVHHAVSLMYEVNVSLMPPAIVFNFLRFDDILAESRNTQRMFGLRKHMGNSLQIVLSFIQLLSLCGRDSMLTVWGGKGTPPEHHRSPFAGTVRAWRPGLDLIGRRVERPLICHHLGDNLSDWMLPHWPLFVLWTDNKTVCVRLCWEGRVKEKNDNDEGTGEKQGFWVILKISKLFHPLWRFVLLWGLSKHEAEMS